MLAPAIVALMLLAPPATPAAAGASQAQQYARRFSSAKGKAEILKTFGQGKVLSTGTRRKLEWRARMWLYTGEFDAAGKRITHYVAGPEAPAGLDDAATLAAVLEIMEDEPPTLDETVTLETRLFTFADGSQAKADFIGESLVGLTFPGAKPLPMTQAMSAREKATAGTPVDAAVRALGSSGKTTATSTWVKYEWKSVDVASDDPTFHRVNAWFDEKGNAHETEKIYSRNSMLELSGLETLAQFEKALGPHGAALGKRAVETRSWSFADGSTLLVELRDGVVLSATAR